MKLRKTTGLVLLLLVAALLAGCGATEKKNTVVAAPAASVANSSQPIEENPAEADQAQAQEVAENTEKNYNSDTLPWTYKIPGCEVYVSVPNLQEVTYGYSEAFLVKKNRLFAVTCDKDDSCDDLSMAHDLCLDKFIACIQDAVFANSLSIVSDSDETINGIDFYKFEGTMNCGHSTPYDAYIIGYSFVMEGYPCSIIGMASHDDQSDELIDEIRKTVNEMVQTVRTEE